LTVSAKYDNIILTKAKENKNMRRVVYRVDFKNGEHITVHTKEEAERAGGASVTLQLETIRPKTAKPKRYMRSLVR
jgi:hypothetical protein